MNKKTNLFSQYTLWSAILFIAGCASVGPDYSIYDYPEPEKKGIYHKVKKGETIWRIAKTYDVSINDIVRTNNIPNVTNVVENQLVFIPGVDTIRSITLDEADTEKDFVWPVKGKVVGYFHQHQSARLNKGIDIKTQRGETVKAARSGLVVFADDLSGYGKTIIIDHKDGFYTVYARNAKLLVELDDFVPKSKAISYVGGDQNLAFLHFQVRKNSIEHNPLHYLP